MSLLMIETSSDQGFVALAQETEVSGWLPFPSSSAVAEAVKSLMFEQQINSQQLKCIALGKGPGSYTGLRVGAAFALALAYGLRIPLVGFCSLLAFLPARNGRFATLLPAKQNEICLVTGMMQCGAVTYTTEHQRINRDKIDLLLDKADFVVSPTPIPGKESYLPHPNPAPIAPLAWQHFLSEQYEDLHQPKLFYLYD